MALKGTVTALITPFKEEKLDLDGLRRNIDFQIESGVSGILPLGTTGESATLTREERESVLSTAVAVTKGRVPIWAGTGTNATAETIERTLRAQDLGADLALIVTPYYNKPTQEGIFRHFEAVSAAVSIPLVVYNIEGRTARNIETETLKRIAELPHVAGVKEASGNLLQISEVIREIPKLAVFSGDDALTLPAMALGACGVVSVVSNLIPREMVAFTAALLEGRWKEAQELHHRLFPLFRAAFLEVNPVPIKEAMTLCKMAAGGPRLPLCELLPHNRERLKAVLQQMDLL